MLLYYISLGIVGLATATQTVFQPGSPLSACPRDPPASCPLPSGSTCCSNSPGGQLLLTQFWDAAPTFGPVDSWTIHGLWPDRCDGSYEASCDSSRVYHNITEILAAGEGQEVLDYMKIYWPSYDRNDERFWQHEWSKHGTCCSTLEPSCYGAAYRPQEEVVAFFNTTVRVFKTLPSYQWLTEAGIIPSRTATYTLEQLQDVAKEKFGHEVRFNCQRGWLNEIHYAFVVKGTVQSGEFISSPPPGGSKSTCPAINIRWLPKSAPGDPPPPRPTGAPSGKVFIDVLPKSLGTIPHGSLISTGKWMVGATAAGFKSIRDSDGKGFSLSTSKGPCAITRAGSFICQNGQTATTFFADDDRNILYRGKSAFYSAIIPSGPKQATVVTGKAAEQIKLRLSE